MSASIAATARDRAGWAFKSGHGAQALPVRRGEDARMNTLTEAQRERVLALLRAGKSLRRIESETGHRRETIATYGRRAGLLGGDVARVEISKSPASPKTSMMLAA